MRKNKIVVGLFLVMTLHLSATSVSVRILTAKVIRSFMFTPVEGRYSVYGDGILLTDYDASGPLQMEMEGDFIVLKMVEKNIGKFSSVKITIANNAEGMFKIKSTTPAVKARTYADDLIITIATDKKQFLLINKVDIEKYIAGVVESESGTRTSLEYYKLQSILCRTYLLANITRHAVEGFQVCDDVHCQVYLSKTTNKEVKQAVYETKGLVVVDADLNLITAAFHSNCGGETCNSQDVWAIPTSYLKSVKDTFCLHQPHTHWKREIPLEDWKSYLQLKHNYPIDDSLKLNNPTSFTQLNGRSIYFVDEGLKIPLKIIRADFQLKSTYFSIEQIGNKIVFIGRGYGHGVGLCQEGAMHMADLKYSYNDILHFYYKGVDVIDYAALSYFRQE